MKFQLFAFAFLREKSLAVITERCCHQVSLRQDQRTKIAGLVAKLDLQMPSGFSEGTCGIKTESLLDVPGFRRVKFQIILKHPLSLVCVEDFGTWIGPSILLLCATP